MKELNEFVSVLNAECAALKKKGLIQESIEEGWRFYSPPMDDEHEYEPLRSVLEAGRLMLKAEEALVSEEKSAWQLLAMAQGALLKSLSTHGKAIAKAKGNAKGGEFRSDEIYYLVFCLADDLIASGSPRRGLAAKINLGLAKKGITKTDGQVRSILKKINDKLVNR